MHSTSQQNIIFVPCFIASDTLKENTLDEWLNQVYWILDALQKQSPLELHNVSVRQVFMLMRALCFSSWSLNIFSNSYELPNEDLTVPAAHSHVVDSAYMVYVSSKLNVSKVGMQGLERSSFRGAWNVVLEVSVIGIGNQAFHWSLSFYVCPCSLFKKTYLYKWLQVTTF